jgi:hypothetical protein
MASPLLSRRGEYQRHAKAEESGSASQFADAEVLAELGRHLTMERPADIEPGTSQRSMLVLRVPVTLPGPGRYVAIASINGTPDARVAFRALATPHAM